MKETQIKTIWDSDLDPLDRIHQQVKRRYLIRRSVEGNLGLQSKVLLRSARDPVGWICDWVWTYDPRNLDIGLPSKIPFDLFPRQIELVQWMLDQASKKMNPRAIVEKTRDFGVSWLVMALFTHRWLFMKGFSGGVGSEKEEKVDKIGDTDSLIEKVRFILQTIPKWMLPPTFDFKKHAGYKKIINPDLGNIIKGEQGINIGRGGRSSWYWVDEAAFLSRALDVDASLSRNAHFTLWGSTPSPMGVSSVYAKKRFSGAYPVFECDWFDDPRKTKEWYDLEKAAYIYAPDIFDREVNRKYTTVGDNVVCPDEWIDAAKEIRLPMGTRRILGFDVADSGKNLNVVVVRYGPVVVDVVVWHGIDPTDSAYRAIEIYKEHNADVIYYDGVGVGAGCKGVFRSHNHEYPSNHVNAVSVNTGSGVSDCLYSDRPASELFVNLKAELWWSFRLRLHRTWQYINGHDRTIDLSDLVQLSGDTTSNVQLGQPRFYYTDKGKIQIESKIQLVRRHLPSPDHADAHILAFADEVLHNQVSWFEQLVRGTK